MTAARPMANGSPYEMGSPEDKIWQAGHLAGYKSERAVWRQFSGCKYPQDLTVLREAIGARIEAAQIRGVLSDWGSGFNYGIRGAAAIARDAS